MIRINLLPDSKKQAAAAASGSTQLWAGIYLLVAVLWMVGLGVIYYLKDQDLEQVRRANRELDAEVARLRQRTADLEGLRFRLDHSRRLEQVVGDLNRARTGPLRAVMEMSRILSRPGGPTINPAELERLRQDNPYANFNVNWDVRRLWIDNFSEHERGCAIDGKARSHEDVAEFMRRLTLSELYEWIVLERTRGTRYQDFDVVEFRITCRVRY